MFKSRTTRRPLLHYAVDLLAKKKYTVNEMHGKLTNYLAKYSQAVDQAEVDRVIARLTELKYLNDSEYIGLFIDEQLRRSPQGIMMLKKRLFGKGMDKTLIEQSLQTKSIDELELANIALQKKLKNASRNEPKKFVPKLYRFLISRGFSTAVAIRAIEKQTGQEALI